MADARSFELVVDELARATRLARPAARAAARSVVERALFDPESVSAGEMKLLVERLLPAELRRCGVEDAKRVCDAIAAALAAQALISDDPETPDAIFGRMIRR